MEEKCMIWTQGVGPPPPNCRSTRQWQWQSIWFGLPLSPFRRAIFFSKLAWRFFYLLSISAPKLGTVVMQCKGHCPSWGKPMATTVSSPHFTFQRPHSRCKKRRFVRKLCFGWNVNQKMCKMSCQNRCSIFFFLDQAQEDTAAMETNEATSYLIRIGKTQVEPIDDKVPALFGLFLCNVCCFLFLFQSWNDCLPSPKLCFCPLTKWTQCANSQVPVKWHHWRTVISCLL